VLLHSGQAFADPCSLFDPEGPEVRVEHLGKGSAVDEFESAVVIGIFVGATGESADRDEDSTVRAMSVDDAAKSPCVLDSDRGCVILHSMSMTSRCPGVCLVAITLRRPSRDGDVSSTVQPKFDRGPRQALRVLGG
jgi:hypothetical protein